MSFKRLTFHIKYLFSPIFIGMALRLLSAAARNWKNFAISNGPSKQIFRCYTSDSLLKIQLPTIDTVRSISFLNTSKYPYKT